MRVDRGKRGRSSLYRGFRLGVSNLVLLTLPRLSSWLISWLIGRRIMIERALGAKGGEFSSSGKFWVSEKGVAQCIIAGFGVFEGKGQSFLLLWWLWFLERWRNHLGFGAISLECACWDWLKCPVASRKSRSTSKGRSGARRDVGRNRFGESSNGKGKAAVEEEDEFMEAGEENLELLQIGGSRKRVRNSGNENGSGFVVEDVD
ncbi:hypothetical protein ACFX2H_031836 [Malus domestica]